MSKIALFLVFIGLNSAFGQHPLLKYLDSYDPENKVATFKWDVCYKMSRLGKEPLLVHVLLQKNKFKYEVLMGSEPYVLQLKGNLFKIQAEKSLIDSLKLNKERTIYLRGAYQYLLGMPMLLRKDTVFVDTTVYSEILRGVPCKFFRVNYPGDTETWEVFFDEKDELIAYRFYKKGPRLDGETIFLSDFRWFKGLYIPYKRVWYWNATGEFFREDTLETNKGSVDPLNNN